MIFEKWFANHTKVISLHYCKEWDKPHFQVYTNGGKRKNGDYCFDFNINFGRLAFSYTNFNLQKQIKK